jgi:hypothetical protein
MTNLFHTRTKVEVNPAEYQRLLGYPRDRQLDGRASDLAAAAREWYEQYGSPWTYSQRCDELHVADDMVRIDGSSFVSPRFAAMLRESAANAVILVAASAGAELVSEAQRLWKDEKPDEYFFLEMYGSAVVEYLLTMKGAELCAEAEVSGAAVLPHYSPGYSDWDVAQQPKLLELLRSGDNQLPGELDVLESGMLRPKKSLLAVFGVTPQRERVSKFATLNSCERCSFQSCQFRRSPYLEAPRSFSADELAQATELISQLVPSVSPLDRDATYTVNRKALRRWADSRLTVDERENGVLEARFQFEGTTCSNLGQPLHFEYLVTLGPRAEGYVISSLTCQPTPGHQGYMAMCRYLKDADPLMASIANEKPLLGEPLNRVLTWRPPHSVAGCYCEQSDRLHKWRLVFETIHFALVEREQATNRADFQTVK